MTAVAEKKTAPPSIHRAPRRLSFGTDAFEMSGDAGGEDNGYPIREHEEEKPYGFGLSVYHRDRAPLVGILRAGAIHVRQR